ncbi:hypothetical protein DUG83_24160 [Vibrio parahaemolyticus]|uniref:Uncharacterized protein n=1 Tax=Vibrio cidicii TaxID=1763883 RepID=A0A151KS99_9VIBR|nr:hypothetical protein [Vibrio cidicii]EGQ8088706.1 hypothetical protein [Vibrio vulnificus]EGR2724511.1 hypothetical protein [Vibrio parahaemolyticus]EGS6764403.1 hypothetical protein [Vibrio parahaemolyticus]EGY8744493.1 hypothetical protein [Vibrio parahaemolyticus]EHD0099269.1 hypothetical protein [Vibrio vulnificus]
MGILVFIATIVLVEFIEAQLGFTYNIFLDPFSVKLAALDIVLFVSIYAVLTFVYEKSGKYLRKKQKR